MALPGDIAALQKPQPVRPLEPSWLYNFLSNSGLSKKTTRAVVLALGRYNKSVNKAGERFQKDLKDINKSI
jgi:hypothetical protein